MPVVVCPFCVGKAAASRYPLTSEWHAEAEAAFGQVVAKQVVQLGCPSTVCDAVTELDDQVQRGLVRRQVAASIASSMHPIDAAGRFYPSNLLRCVLQPAKHETNDCKCLDKVLAWGCCPTQVLVWPPQQRWGSLGTSVCLALGHRETRPQWVRVLLTYGCIPCQQYRQLTNKVTGHVTLVPERYGCSPWLKARMLERARWHPRCLKRQWVAAMVP
jgi:hypothetical protein